MLDYWLYLEKLRQNSHISCSGSGSSQSIDVQSCFGFTKKYPVKKAISFFFPLGDLAFNIYQPVLPAP